jgi:hypothetical protein
MHVYASLLFIFCQESGNKLHGNAEHVEIFANSITDTNSICGLMDCSATDFVDEFSNFLHFQSFCWCLVALNVRHLQLTIETWMPFRNRCSAERMLSKSLTMHFKGFGSGCKTWCGHIARFCHQPQTKWNTTSKKHWCKNNACSQRCVTWQPNAVGLRKCDLGLPPHLLSPW